MLWKEVVIAKFEVLSQNLPGWTEENHEDPQLVQSLLQLRFECGTSEIQTRNNTA
jgi:Uma2 family endonuclease